MLTLIWDNKAFYGLPIGLLFGYLSEFKNLTEKKKEEDKKEITHKKNDGPTFEIPNFDSQPNLDDSLLENIPKLDYETLRHEVEHSLRVGKDMNYGNYNIAGLILSNLKLFIKKNSSN